MAGSVRELVLKLVGQADTAGIGKAADQIDDVGKKAQGATGHASKFGGALGSVGTIAGGIVAGAGISALPGLLMAGAKGAAEDEASLQRLRTAIDNTGSSSSDYGGAIDDLIGKGQDLAFTDGEVTDALSNLVSMTGSTEEGMSRMNAAMDLARGANISLEQASKLLGKTSDENTAALGRLGIKLGEGATATDVLAEVQARFGGQAQQYASSAAGEYAKFQNQLVELQETVGAALIPVFQALMPVIDAVVPFIAVIAEGLAQVTSTTPGLIAFGAVLAAAIVPSLIAATAATIAWTVALLTNPIFLIITGLVALGAAIYLLIDNFDAVSAAAVSAWDTVKGAFQTVFNWIKENWPLLITIIAGPIGAAAALVITHWGAIQGAFETAIGIIEGLINTTWAALQDYLITPIQTAVDTLTTAWGTLQGVFESSVGAVSTLISGTWAALEGLMTTPIQAASDLISGIWTALQSAFSTAVDTVVSLISGTWSTLESLMSAPVDAAQLLIKTYIDLVIGYYSFLWETVSGLLTGAWTAVEGLLTGPVNSAKDIISTTLETVVTFFTELPGKIATALSGLASQLYETGKNAINNLRDGAAAVVGTMLSYLGEIPGRIVSALGDVASLLYNAGRAIIQGMINGIKSMAQAAADAAVGVAQDALDAVTGFLGIGSPSKLYYEIGRDTIQGYINGVQSMEGPLVNAVVGVLSGPVTAGDIGLGARPSGGRGGSVAHTGGWGYNIAGGTHVRAGLYGGSGQVYTPNFVLPGDAWSGGRPGYNWFGGGGRPFYHGVYGGGKDPWGTGGRLPDMSGGRYPALHPVIDSFNPPGYTRSGPIYLVLPDGRVLAEVVTEEQSTVARTQGMFRSYR